MNVDDHWIPAAGFELPRINQESLHVECVALPSNVHGFAPVGLLAGVDVSELSKVVRSAGPYLRRCAE